jgi:ribosomal protein S18 acetylase RimI-like enzyme
MHISKITPYQFEVVVDLITRLQPNDETHIGYFGIEADDIRQYLSEFDHGWENSIVVAIHHDQVVGCLAVEWDTEVGRAWLHGPCIDHAAWHIIADKLYKGAQELGVLPAGLEEELFGDVVNVKLGAFARRHDFRRMDNFSALVRFKRENLATLPPTTVDLLTENYHDEFIALHEKTFPNTYYIGKQILEKLDEKNRVFVATENNTLLGYLYAKIDTGGQGYIDFVGVAESARRKGIGKRLVVAATRWLLSFESAHEVNLTVTSTYHPAIELYFSVGYEHVFTLAAYRKKPSP